MFGPTIFINILCLIVHATSQRERRPIPIDPHLTTIAFFHHNVIQVDIGGHPPIPFGPAPSILAAFHIQHNLLFLVGFRVLHSQSHFGS